MRRFNDPDQPDQPGRPVRDGPAAANNANNADQSAMTDIPASLPAIKVDWRLYEHHLADTDLTDDEKREFLEALWYIVLTFVDLGFGIEPVQQAMKAAADCATQKDEQEAPSGRASPLGTAFGGTRPKPNQKGDAPGRTTT
jgi:hypothetical protein